MDYDDTDFQSRNFQLAGEDNSKSPSGLRPFALPKLDIDDQLQGHLRFDSLTDSEGFFSVGHDNSWIEVLSTGSSVGLSAAQSRSISRTSYVWSEATSTECVEMLLKSVGESEMTGNMDDSAHRPLSGMDSQIDPSSTQPRSSNTPSDSIVVPTVNDQSQGACSRIPEDPSTNKPQFEGIAPFSMDEKAEHGAGSILSGRKSNYMLDSVPAKHIVSEKLSPASKSAPESCPALGNYFEVVQDGGSLDNLNVHSAGVDSRKLNDEPFSEFAPIQNIYSTGSYRFEQENHVHANKLDGGMHELQKLTESSDGLLEAITNPVKMLRRSDACKSVNASLQPSFSQVEHAAEGLQISADTSNKLVIEKFGIGEEPGSAKSSQYCPDLKNSNPHLVTPLSTKSSELIQSPNRKQLAHVTGVPEEPKGDGVDDTNIDVSKHGVLEQHEEQVNLKNVVIDDTNINTGDNSKLGVLEQRQDSADNKKSVVMEEKPIMEEISALSGKSKCLVEASVVENARGLTGTSEDEFDSSGNVAPDNSSAGLLDKMDPDISPVNHEGPVKEDGMPALKDEPGDQHLVSPNSGSQEKKMAPMDILGSKVAATTVADTSNTTMHKLDCSEGVPSDGSPAGILDGNDLTISSVNHVESFDEGANSSEVGGHDVSSVPEPSGKKPAVSENSNVNAVWSSHADPVTKGMQCTDQASLGSLTMSQTQDKSGDHPDAQEQKCQTDRPSVRSEHQESSHPQNCQIDGPSVQSEYHEDLATPSSSVSSDKAAQTVTESPLKEKDDLNVYIKDIDGSCKDATCGSPTVISCTEPCLQEGGQDGSAVFCHTITERSDDKKDHEASAGASRSSKECSTGSIEPTLSSEEANTAGDDRSFSFEVGDAPKVSEKAHSPAWSPFPRSKAAQSVEATIEISKPGSPGNALRHTSEEGKKTSVLEAGKEQQSATKGLQSVGALSVSSHTGDITKTKSAPVEQPKQHSMPASTAVVHQPFTESQHFELRAQIFVYGALIQGIPPAETYMVSAFGEFVGGGKSAWEAVWRAAVERFQNQKSPLAGLETPTSSHTGSRVAEKTPSKGTAVKTASASRKGGKTALPAYTSVQLHSPTFNMSPLASSTLNLQRSSNLDFSQAVSPVFNYNSQTRQPTSAVASWFPQSPGPRAAPWLAPPQNLIFDSSMQPTVPSSESAKGSSTVASPLAVVHEEKQKTPSSTSKRSRVGTASQKPRKRKKDSGSPEQQPDIASSQLRADLASVTPATKHIPGFTLSTPSPSNVLGSGLVPNTSLITSVPNYLGGKSADHRIIFSEQITGAVDQSMDQAKCASMYSMEALRLSEGVWNHLPTNSKGKLPADVEQKLTSAAAAASAALSVAKAAAEAAKMATTAALQAKMMAEEALGSSKSANLLQKRDTGEVDANNNLASVSSLTPKSSWKIKDSTHAPGSTISVAREVARKRVEEASAAAKRAENLDAILKAAELAAEAVFKAGSIIGMGEPLPFTLSELLEAGPDGFWKSDRVKNTKAGNTIDNVVIEELELPTDINKSGRKRGSKAKYDQAIQNLEPSSSVQELQPDGLATDINKSGRKHGSKAKYDQAIQNLEPPSSVQELQPDGMHSGNGVEDDPTAAPLNGNTNNTAPSIIWNGIGKGSPVEVLADGGGSGAAWFSAKVLDINEDSAFISYESHSEGAGPCTQWVSLKQEGEKAPQIRLAHPATMSKLKGTRKRRRDTAGNYSWAIGDHVDAWIKNSWREGIIAKNCEFGEAKFTVQFSVGDSVVVDTWNLRPSLVWKDGEWTEWSRAHERKDKSNKGDSPYEKRQRTAVSDPLPAVGEARPPSKDKITNTVKKLEEPKPLALSDKDMIFNIGKSAIENKTTRRPGLQKEGSKVFGVPKPGKKKKFMDVSKHYVADHTDKISEGSTSTRFEKQPVSQIPRLRESTLKLDQRAKRVGDTRSRGLKSVKSQNSSTSSLPGKDPLSIPVPGSSALENSFGFVGNMTSSSNPVNPNAEKNNSAHSTDLRTEDASVLESRVHATPSVPTAKKKPTTIDRAKRKYVPSMDNNLNRRVPKTPEILGQTGSDSAEPRRSNRRIQPTSRLLEGMQSSLILSKVTGEKVPRTNFRSATSSSRGKAHG